MAEEDFSGSHLPEAGRAVGVPLCTAHATAYHTLRGHQKCVTSSCTRLGTVGPRGEYYCPAHMASAATPLPPAPKVSFGKEGDKGRRGSTGLSSFPDAVVLALYENADPTGKLYQAKVVGDLTSRYGGDLIHNALKVKDAPGGEYSVLNEGFGPRLQDSDPDIVVGTPSMIQPKPYGSESAQVVRGRVLDTKPALRRISGQSTTGVDLTSLTDSAPGVGEENTPRKKAYSFGRSPSGVGKPQASGLQYSQVMPPPVTFAPDGMHPMGTDVRSSITVSQTLGHFPIPPLSLLWRRARIRYCLLWFTIWTGWRTRTLDYFSRPNVVIRIDSYRCKSFTRKAYARNFDFSDFRILSATGGNFGFPQKL